MNAAKRPNYFLVFFGLAAFTLVEVLVSYVQIEALKIPTLLALAVIKVVLVLLYFMHLRTDAKVYSYLFIAGAALVIPLVLVMMIVMPILY